MNQQTVISSELFRPRSLIIKDRFVYWMDGLSKNRRAKGFKLERYNVENGKRETVCHSKDKTINPFSMDINDNQDSVYVSDWLNMAVWKLDLNQTDSERYKLFILLRAMLLYNKMIDFRMSLIFILLQLWIENHSSLQTFKTNGCNDNTVVRTTIATNLW